MSGLGAGQRAMDATFLGRDGEAVGGSGSASRRGAGRAVDGAAQQSVSQAQATSCFPGVSWPGRSLGGAAAVTWARPSPAVCSGSLSLGCPKI